MTKKIENYSVRTDLAVESHEMLHSTEEDIDISGIKINILENKNKNIKVTQVEVLNEEGARQMSKPIGTYITIESDSMKENDISTHEEISEILSQELLKLHKLDKDDVILIIGLGNWNVTPDALGPKVVSKLLVTRHIADSMPRELKGGIRPVGAIAPGVMGITGIETLEIVKGVSDRVQPTLLIAIDALAARCTGRINSTIQMSNTGISPGAGIGNKRMSISQESLGIPVISIGVPTVVDAATLVNDTLDKMLDSMLQSVEKGSDFYQMLLDLEEEEKYSLIKELLNPYAGNMFVAPKEVDAVIERLSRIIANSINIALHPGIHLNDINRYLDM